MSHYPGVTVLVRFSLFIVFVCCLFVGIGLVCLCVLLFVCLICLSVCIIEFCIAVCIWAYGQNTINRLKSLSLSLSCYTESDHLSMYTRAGNSLNTITV